LEKERLGGHKRIELYRSNIKQQYHLEGTGNINYY
jgi:hypothetical protein